MINSPGLTTLGRYNSGIFDEGAAEIADYDPISQRLFVVNGADKTIDVLNLNNPNNPTFEFAIAIADFGDGVNSVAVKNGIVAAAIESDPSQDPGQVVFFDTDGNVLNQVTVGALPDMVTFTPDGNKVLVANEGEPNEDDPSNDPEGSVSIIDISQGITQAKVITADFQQFNGQEATLRSREVRIFPDRNFSQDVEPEYITVSSDSTTAYVTLQENNAVAVVDIESGITDIQPLGLKDFSRGLPQLTNYPIDLSEQVLGTTPAGQEILLGRFSGLFYEGETTDGKLKFIVTPDRGPNGEPTDVDGDGVKERPFPLPDYQPRLVRLTLDRATGEVEIGEQIFLDRNQGKTPLTGLPNIQAGEADTAYTDEEPVDLLGNSLDNDPFGADLESIVVAPDATFWLSDEYRPAIYHFDCNGSYIDRFVPQGTGEAGNGKEGEFGTETLPAVYAQRRSNRGFEGMALNTDNGKLYAFIQSPLDNPDVSDDSNSSNSQVLRILEVDSATGVTTGEYIYLLEGSPGVDKIGDAVYAGDGKINVIERDSGTDADAKKFIFEVDLTGATNILGTDLATANTTDTALESMTADDLAEMGIKPVTKTKVLNLPSIGYLAGDKPEGLALLPNGSLAVINDNDFGLLDSEIPLDGSVPFNQDPTQTTLGIIDFNIPNGLDASEQDGGINIRNYPVFGMYQPDSIASYEVDGETYYITANEGDARDEDTAIEDLELDPTAFPNAEELQITSQIGGLEVSNIDGDIDGDGDYDRLVSYGGRSFSIRDRTGNLVFDSGDQLEQITAQQVPELFNSNGTVDTFDSRSTAKGAEPEGVVVGEINDRTYAFIGLERTSGVVIYDVTDPAKSSFVKYINPIDPETGNALDLGPEGLKFIPSKDSPNNQPLLVVTNEVSGSTTVYQVDLPINGGKNADGSFTLQLLHAADQEAGIPAIEDAPNFSAVLNALRDDYNNTLTLSSGDAYIPSPFFSAGEAAFGGQGRGDILIQNQLGFQAIAFGNHEFDFGTATVADLISADAETDYPGTAFPYLSSNLDFSTDEDLAPLVVEDGQVAEDIPNSITGNTIINVNGEQIGVVGATTPTLSSISSPGDVTIKPLEFSSDNPQDIAALATEIQASVDSLLADNPEINKVVLLAHMQQISIEEQLSALLTDVDIIVAGGSNTLLADQSDRLRAGDIADGVYPILNTDADGNPVAVVNTDGNYKYVGRLVVDFDENGIIIPDSIDPEISGAYATDSEGVTAVEGTVDPKIVEITSQLETAIAEQEGNIFGKTDVFLNGSREDVRTQETNFGNLTADANLAYAQTIDPDVLISLKNGGGIRDNIGTVIAPPGSTNVDDVQKLPTQANELAGKQEGDISQLDIANSLRFNNGLTILTVTAAELLAVIEHGVAESGEGETPGSFPQVAGIEFSFDSDLPAGERVVSLAVKDAEGNIIDTIVENGELVGDDTRTFRVVTLSFLADGGDDYSFPNRDRIDLALDEDADRSGNAVFAPDGSEQDVLAEYLLQNYSDNAFTTEDLSPELDTRIQNLNLRNDGVLSEGTVNNNVTGIIDPLIDLTGLENQSTTFSVSDENYTLGVYQLNADGSVIDPLSGNSIMPGEDGYTQAAIANPLELDSITASEFTAKLSGDSLYAPYIIVDGTVDQLIDQDISNDPAVYFPYTQASSGNQDYIRALDDLSWEFGDLSSNEIQDLLVKADVA
ncbi:alkaline phosphatase [Chondrocystis sp. NIES-4102]|nr:alkaline phosphatase [Chondrocystis sp. NIES-4102]